MWRYKILNSGLVFLLLLNLWLGYQLCTTVNPRLLKLYILDVGQGDSILIRTPDGGLGLIDGGRGASVVDELQSVLPFGQRHLNFVLATHPDADHIEGLISVLQRYQVDQIFIAKSSSTSGVYAELADRIRLEKIVQYELRDDNDFRLGCCTGFNILWPRETYDVFGETETNKISTALILSYGKLKVFLGGDLPSSEELDATTGLTEQVQVLKVGHHGSRTSTSNEFLNRLRPQLALISDGLNNSYGHPHPEVLKNLTDHQLQTLRTDNDGRIELESDGESYSVSSLKRVENFYVRL